MVSLHQLLKVMIEQRASDLHITTEAPPTLRIDGRLVPVRTPPLDPSQTKDLCFSILTEVQKQRFDEEKELDFSFGIRGLSRFRGNLYRQKGAVAGSFRMIPYEIPSFSDLGLPPILSELARKPRGLLLVTGPTGSGKSTTLAAMLDQINDEQPVHILTVEDPIEYLHHHKRAIVNQREVGEDTDAFRKALRHVLRQDPDVVLIGELRDLETMEAALNLSETGHLVLATLHTNNCVQTMNRIVDVFPPYQQPQVRSQLSFVLQGVVSQSLIPTSSGRGRAMAIEVLVPTPAIRNLIREEKVHMIYSQMQMGQAQTGSITMNQSLAQLVREEIIDFSEAMAKTSEPAELRQMLQRQNP